MANVRLNWSLPTTRESGKPLNPADIAGVEIAVSADAGQNYVVSDVVTPATLETLFTDMEPGTWMFRGVVVDVAGKRSRDKFAQVVVPDLTPPGTLVTLEATLV
jgi:hypothetical protein